MKLEKNQERFIQYLLGLAREGHEDRGALAELRSGLGKKPGDMAKVHRHVVPFLPESSGWNDWFYYLVATLFGLHPRHKDPDVKESEGKEYRDYYTLGNALGSIWEQRDYPPSIEGRFIALLNAHTDDLDIHLRQTIGLLKAHDTPLDWRRFFYDLLNWESRDSSVQQRWARDFYKHRRKEPAEDHGDIGNRQEKEEK